MKCKCGETDGFYKFTPVRGKIVINYDGNGNYATDNDSMYDGIEYGQEQKSSYCKSCCKKLTQKELDKKITEKEVEETK